MKRIITITAALLMALSAAAQMMPDSTVQIVSYWQVGDKYAYTCERSSKEVDAQGQGDAEPDGLDRTVGQTLQIGDLFNVIAHQNDVGSFHSDIDNSSTKWAFIKVVDAVPTYGMNQDNYSTNPYAGQYIGYDSIYKI